MQVGGERNHLKAYNYLLRSFHMKEPSAEKVITNSRTSLKHLMDTKPSLVAAIALDLPVQSFLLPSSQFSVLISQLGSTVHQEFEASIRIRTPFPHFMAHSTYGFGLVVSVCATCVQLS